MLMVHSDYCGVCSVVGMGVAVSTPHNPSSLVKLLRCRRKGRGMLHNPRGVEKDAYISAARLYQRFAEGG